MKYIIHPLSCVILVACDYLWTLVEWAAFLWLITIPLTFTLTAVPIYFIQRHLNDDKNQKAFVIAGVCGFLAALPTPIMGTVAGAGFLVAAGLKKISNHENEKN